MPHTASLAISWTEQGLVPDIAIRHGIRRLLRQRLAEIHAHDCELAAELTQRMAVELPGSDIAVLTDKANEQHYEVPAGFFSLVLGSHLKYSSCYWPADARTLDEAEAAALRQTCQHADIQDHQDILELGCGWGSLTLWMAERYPNSQITAVSNSHSQRDFIEAQAEQRGLTNISIITRDMNQFEAQNRYDRIVSVEMFEHMRNWPGLFQRLSTWLNDGGRFFMHVFCHRNVAYLFEDNGASDWMSRHFFSGGMMPSDDLPLLFQDHLKLQQRWRWGGRHYEKTAEAWLANMDAHKAEIWPLFAGVYGKDATQQWWMRWRIFFMACAELFAYDDGQQWWVSHYLFEKRPGRPS